MYRFSSTTKLITVTFLLTAIALAGYIMAFLYIRGANQDIAELRNTIDRQLRVEAQLKSIKDILEDTKEERELLSGYFVDQDAVVSFIEKVESLAEATDVIINIISVDLIESESKSHQQLALKFSSIGSWDGTTHFIALLEVLPNHIVVTHTNLSSKLEGEGSSIWNGSFAIDVAMLK